MEVVGDLTRAVLWCDENEALFGVGSEGKKVQAQDGEQTSELLAGESMMLSPVCLVTSLMVSSSKSLAFTLSLQLPNRIKSKLS